jgi:SAM-dependent methyltransferase
VKKNRNQLYENEVTFFSKLYGGEEFNPVGWTLRLRREKNNLLRLSGKKYLGRVLSLGCGDGQFEIMLAPYAEKIVGIDISSEAIRSARLSAKKMEIGNVEFRLQAIDNIQEKEKFDTIICLAFLHHISPSDVLPLLRSIYRHLSAGGNFYSQDPSINGILRKIGHRLFQNWTSKFHSPDEYELDPVELDRQLSVSGFNDICIGYNDLTLIPGLYVIKRGFSVLMHLMLYFDWIWCHSPYARWSSCFYLYAKK